MNCCKKGKKKLEDPADIMLAERDSLSMFPFEEDEYGPQESEMQKKSCVDPRHNAIFFWETSLAITSFFNALLVSFQLSFCFYESFVFVIGYIFDLNFLFGIILRFYMAFYNRDGVIVEDRYKLRHRYLRTKFLLDVAAIFPLDLFCLVGDNPIKLLPYFRLNRVIQIYRGIHFFSKLYN